MTDSIEINGREVPRTNNNKNRQIYTSINKEIEKQTQAAKEYWLKWKEVEQLQKHRELHQKLKEIVGKRNKIVSIIQNENNETELDPEK